MSEYVPPFYARTNVADPGLVTIVDSRGQPMLTTHDEKLAERTVQALMADAIGCLPLPGWTCSGCGVFNGTMKHVWPECRSCGFPRSM